VISLLVLMWVYWVGINKVVSTVDGLYYAFLLSALFILACTVLLTLLNTVLPLNGVADA